MCIIVHKPQNTKFPSENTLRECFQNNDDGAGFMFSSNNVVHIKKGFMTFEKFYKALKKSIRKYGENLPYVMHFRISTQAGVSPEFTHPYPLSSNLSVLKRLSTNTNIGIAHNGIISLTSNAKAKKSNDTMDFITDYLSLIIRDENYYKDTRNLKLIDKLGESKFAILDGKGHCELIGNFYQEEGIYYSNKTYLPYIKQWTPYSYSLFEEEQYFESFYNDETQVYDFDVLDCPSLYGYDEFYCEVCANYHKCFNPTK